MSESVLTVSQSLPPVPEPVDHASFRSFDPSHPLYPLQLDACVDWNADTGATSHMTPHRLFKSHLEMTVNAQSYCVSN